MIANPKKDGMGYLREDVEANASKGRRSDRWGKRHERIRMMALDKFLLYSNAW